MPGTCCTRQVSLATPRLASSPAEQLPNARQPRLKLSYRAAPPASAAAGDLAARSHSPSAAASAHNTAQPPHTTAHLVLVPRVGGGGVVPPVAIHGLVLVLCTQHQRGRCCERVWPDVLLQWEPPCLQPRGNTATNSAQRAAHLRRPCHASAGRLWPAGAAEQLPGPAGQRLATQTCWLKESTGPQINLLCALHESSGAVCLSACFTWGEAEAVDEPNAPPLIKGLLCRLEQQREHVCRGNGRAALARPVRAC
jgi:hypothetical protein